MVYNFQIHFHNVQSNVEVILKLATSRLYYYPKYMSVLKLTLSNTNRTRDHKVIGKVIKK